MLIVDFILNLAGLLIWLGWRSKRFDPLIKGRPATLMGTLRPASTKPRHRWHLLALIGGMLLLRALIYWGMGLEKSGKLNLGLVVLYFSNSLHWRGWAGFEHMLIYSFSSFGLMLGVFYLWILLLSLLSGPMPIHGLVAIPLGRVDGWPRWIKAALPLVGTGIVWLLGSWCLNWLHLLPEISVASRLKQSLLIGLSSYLQWVYPLGAILILHLVNSYVYFGSHPGWRYVTATAETLLRPLEKLPLRVGRVDFAPLVGAGLVFLAAHFAELGLNRLYYPASSPSAAVSGHAGQFDGNGRTHANVAVNQQLTAVQFHEFFRNGQPQAEAL
jgi:uncharacterized protein YggT (Ycf19 family)